MLKSDTLLAAFLIGVGRIAWVKFQSNRAKFSHHKLIRFAGPEGARTLKAKMLHVEPFLRGNVSAIQRNMVKNHNDTGFDLGY